MNWIYAPQLTNMLTRRCGELMRTTRDGIDWRRPQIRDSAVIFGIFAAVWACTHWFDLAPRFFQFGTDHADWEVDDLTFVFCVMSIVLVIYSFRRVKDLSHEVKS